MIADIQGMTVAALIRALLDDYATRARERLTDPEMWPAIRHEQLDPGLDDIPGVWIDVVELDGDGVFNDYGPWDD